MNFIENPQQKILNPIQNKKAPLGRVNEYLNLTVNFSEYAYGPYMARELIKAAKSVLTGNIKLKAFIISTIRTTIIVVLTILFKDQYDDEDSLNVG